MDGKMGGYLDGYAGTIEVLEGRSGRRLRSEAERARIGAESLVPGAKVADIARRHGVTRWQVYDWRNKLDTSRTLLVSP
ncbi:transposase [Salipiger aestuarii]|uniref:transposase n=1 Tax=Salipiger aestuarii TaxID=568098 RepID=UPI001CC2E045|nr:transposase [Salipiger aestuarii]